MICDFEIKITRMEFKILKLNINLDCVNFWTMNEIYIESYIEIDLWFTKFGKTCWNINILGINYIILIIIEYSGILSD